MNARAALIALLALAAGCGGDSVTGPGQAPAELTQVLDEMNSPSVALATSAMSGIPIASPGPLAAASCSYAADSRSFVCPTVTSHGLTFNRSFTLLDASGVPQSQYDVHSTDAVRTTTAMTGTIGPDSMQLVLSNHGVMTLSGLLSGRHVLNGVQTDDISGKGNVWAGSFSSHTVTTTRDLVLPPSTAEPYPRSGTVTMDVTSDFGDLGTETVRMQLSFNGSSRVDVTTTVGSFTTHCTIDLTTRFPFCTPS